MDHFSEVEIRVFSNRVKWRCHQSSVLDLVLLEPPLRRIPIERLSTFTDAMRESLFKSWSKDTITEQCLREIDGEHVELFAD